METLGKLAGLGQGGNTCYIASSLQLLFNTEGWDEFNDGRMCRCGRGTCGSCLVAGTFAGVSAAADVEQTPIDLTFWRPMVAHVGLQPGAQEDPEEFWGRYSTLWSQGTVAPNAEGEFSLVAQSDWKLFMRCLGTETQGRIWKKPTVLIY